MRNPLVQMSHLLTIRKRWDRTSRVMTATCHGAAYSSDRTAHEPAGGLSNEVGGLRTDGPSEYGPPSTVRLPGGVMPQKPPGTSINASRPCGILPSFISRNQLLTG